MLKHQRLFPMKYMLIENDIKFGCLNSNLIFFRKLVMEKPQSLSRMVTL